MFKKINLYNLLSYFRNKFYNRLANIGVSKNIIDNIVNSEEVLKHLQNNAKTNADIEIVFKDGYKIISPVKNIEVVVETCVNKDYNNNFYTINEGDIIFDLGANIGSYSIYAAKKGARVIAFEPDPYNLEYFSKNIELNNLRDKIMVYECAVSDKIGKIKMSINNNHACGSIIDSTNTDKLLEVDTVTINKVISDLDIEKINLFKIDVEGAEYLILPSISTENYSKIERISGEFHLFKTDKKINYSMIKQILSPHYSKIKHKIPYYFLASNTKKQSIMNKDLQSFKKHDKEYNSLYTIDSIKKIIEKFEQNKSFEELGFNKAISKTRGVHTHIDVGCGSGWLIYKTSPLFKKVIGIEPSSAIIEIDKIIIKERGYTNIELFNMDMMDAIEAINPKEPVLVTTATVLSHIKDFYVKTFLKRLGSLPEGSCLFFDERYDKNIQQNMWHIRNKNWWAKNLPSWQLEFFELENSGYKSGIFGVKKKEGEKINLFDLNFSKKLKWKTQGLLNKKDRILRFLKKIIKN